MKILWTISLLFLSLAGVSEGIIDSLSARLNSDIHDTDRVITSNDLAWELMYSNPDTAILLSSKALEVAKANNWKAGIADSYGLLGTFYWLKGNYPQALAQYLAALKINTALGNKAGIAKNLGNLGLVYNDQSNYPKALEHYFKAISINTKLGNTQLISVNLGNIGGVYFSQADYPKALKYYFKTLKMDEESGNQNGVANALGNIGTVNFYLQDYAKAVQYFHKALKISEELGIDNFIATNLGNIGTVYAEQGDYSRALEFYLKSMEMNERLGKKSGQAANLGNIGSLYAQIGEYKKAEVTIQKAIALSKELGVKKFLKTQYQDLSDLYDTTNRPTEAFAAFKLYILYSDSISNEENTKAQTRTEMKYEYEKAALVVEQEEKDASRKMSEARSRRDNLQYSVILIAILILFGSVLTLGFINVGERMAEGIIFFSFLILFEFVLVLADPYIDRWSGGAPGIKLLFNAGIAALIFPMHSFFESKLKKRLST